MKQKKQPSSLPNKVRPPIVAILGHVDHGKTTLLDYIRQAHIAAGEAGGITQSIGAYQAEFKGKKLTFIDTPGHAAFSKMRSRGATTADVAVLVVSAADGVQPQTVESIKHIKSSGIPFVVAINKTDLPDSNPELVKGQLTEHEVFVEGYGGNTPFVLISAKTGKGVDSLLETILLLAELEELKSDCEAALAAPIIEAKLDRRAGISVSAIVKTGTLRVGSELFTASASGKVRALFNDAGQSIPSAVPGMPVQILGFKDLPVVGEIIGTSRPEPLPLVAAAPSLEAVPVNRLALILKADTAGSLEAIRGSLTPEIYLVLAGTGDITESDVLLASTTHALILGFNVRASAAVGKLSETEGVVIKTYKIIYELLEYLEKKTLKLMEPTIDEEELGKASVLKIFDIDGTLVAGCRIDSGTLETGNTVHLKRGEVSKDARIRSIRLGKAETKSVSSGAECGIVLSPNLDLKEKDVIIAYKKLQTED